MSAFNPYAPPRTIDDAATRGRSLVASPKLRMVRATLLVTGGLIAGVNGFLLQQVPAEVAAATRTRQVAADRVQAITRDATSYCDLIYGGSMALGVVIAGLGLVAAESPVAATVAALALYGGLIGILGILDPQSLRQGCIIRGIVVANLFRAFNMARAHHADA